MSILTAFLHHSVISENCAFRLQLVCIANTGRKKKSQRETKQQEMKVAVFHKYSCFKLQNHVPSSDPHKGQSQVRSRSATPTGVDKPAQRPEGNREREEASVSAYLSLCLSAFVPFAFYTPKHTLRAANEPHTVPSPRDAATKMSHRVT